MWEEQIYRQSLEVTLNINQLSEFERIACKCLSSGERDIDREISMLRVSARSAFIDFCIEHEILGLLRAKAPNYWARQLEESGVAKTIEDQETYLQRLFDALDLVDHALDGVPVVLLKMALYANYIRYRLTRRPWATSICSLRK